MRSHFFIPSPHPELTTGPNWLKFSMVPPWVILRGIVEGFFEIRSGRLEMGYPWPGGGAPKVKNLGIFFFKFFNFFEWNRLLDVKIAKKSQNKPLIRESYVSFGFSKASCPFSDSDRSVSFVHDLFLRAYFEFF